MNRSDDIATILLTIFPDSYHVGDPSFYIHKFNYDEDIDPIVFLGWARNHLTSMKHTGYNNN